MGRVERKKKQLPPSSLTSQLVKKCVYVCAYMCECFFVPAASERWRRSEVALVCDVLRLCIWNTSVWEGFFCVLSPFFSSLLPCLLLTPTPEPPSSPLLISSPLPFQHTSKERKKLVHSWFGKKKLNKKQTKMFKHHSFGPVVWFITVWGSAVVFCSARVCVSSWGPLLTLPLIEVLCPYLCFGLVSVGVLSLRC